MTCVLYPSHFGLSFWHFCLNSNGGLRWEATEEYREKQDWERTSNWALNLIQDIWMALCEDQKKICYLLRILNFTHSDLPGSVKTSLFTCSQKWVLILFTLIEDIVMRAT